MTWREAFQAIARNMRVRQKNARNAIGQTSEYDRGHAEGASWAFGVMAEELEYTAEKCPAHEALANIRRLGGTK